MSKKSNRVQMVFRETSCRSCISCLSIDDGMKCSNDLILPRLPVSKAPTTANLHGSDSYVSETSDAATLVTIQELQTKIQMKQGYVQYVSHEIRTPLQVISAGLSLLRDDLKDKVKILVNTSALMEGAGQVIGVEDLRQDLDLVEIMHESTFTAVNILNDLLLYEKVESDMLVIEQQRVHLFDVIIPVVKMFTIPVTAAGVTLTWDLDSLSNVYAMLDANKFGQVLRNLISNAIKFTPRGGSVYVSAVKIDGPKPHIQSALGESTSASSKSLRRKSHPATLSEVTSLLSCETNPLLSKSTDVIARQPSPPTTEMPSPNRRPSLRLFGRRSSFTSVGEDSSAVTTTAGDRFSESFQVGEGVDIQEQTVEPTKPTMYRISVTDSGCGISKVYYLKFDT